MPGTYGSIDFHRDTASGRVRARARFRDYDGQCRAVTRWAGTEVDARARLQAALEERTTFPAGQWGPGARVRSVIPLWKAVAATHAKIRALFSAAALVAAANTFSKTRGTPTSRAGRTPARRPPWECPTSDPSQCPGPGIRSGPGGPRRAPAAGRSTWTHRGVMIWSKARGSTPFATASMLEWVSGQPLGMPVVPDVVDDRCQGAALGLPRRRRSTSSALSPVASAAISVTPPPPRDQTCSRAGRSARTSPPPRVSAASARRRRSSSHSGK